MSNIDPGGTCRRSGLREAHEPTSAPMGRGFAVIGGDAVRNPDADTFSCQLKCHDANGETYYVALARESVRITSYEDDAVLATVETWADGVAALN